MKGMLDIFEAANLLQNMTVAEFAAFLAIQDDLILDGDPTVKDEPIGVLSFEALKSKPRKTQG